uniref:C2H2-type domain-containing protein n=1 Tax=Lotharella oceanica TaxID=641309 RepID=A0A7S2XB70_9EUKA|mmetsp:Transcript_25329/g.47276  ORF Transcript_25329/g.47276 Transcript_25329/m.47276 type:complete len:366 (+) Transcript_25329:56-1153(+)
MGRRLVVMAILAAHFSQMSEGGVSSLRERSPSRGRGRPPRQGSGGLTVNLINKSLVARTPTGWKPIAPFPQGPHMCTHCNLAFVSREELRYHVLQKHRRRPYKCRYCNNSFTQHANRQTHEQSQHGLVQRRFRCSLCNKMFRLKHHLINHNRTHFDDSAPFRCAACSKTFNQIGNMMAHLKYHSGVKPYTCPHCNSSFAVKGTLLRHLKLHSTSRSYQCQFPGCKKDYNDVSNLRQHVLIHHNPMFKCHICLKEFHYRQNLQAHRKRAHPNASTICNECGKVFVREASLKIHEKEQHFGTHFSCPVCTRNFSKKWNMVAHLRVIHDVPQEASLSQENKTWKGSSKPPNPPQLIPLLSCFNRAKNK